MNKFRFENIDSVFTTETNNLRMSISKNFFFRQTKWKHTFIPVVTFIANSITTIRTDCSHNYTSQKSSEVFKRSKVKPQKGGVFDVLEPHSYFNFSPSQNRKKASAATDEWLFNFCIIPEFLFANMRDFTVFVPRWRGVGQFASRQI